MSDRRTDLNPTDEPDGTPAHEASLRPPGESLSTPADAGDADTGVDFEDRDAGDDGMPSRAGYDAGDVSGDTDAVRPLS
jgi:hypothetical protein